MTVDLSKARKGDKVRFRCGGEFTITGKSGEGRLVSISLNDGVGADWYCDGRYLSHEDRPFDIVQIIPAPFDWKDVRPGMGFRHPTFKTIWYYVGKNVSRHGVSTCSHVFRENEADKYNWFGEAMERAPEHDIEVTP